MAVATNVPVLFANTGVQLLAVPLKPGQRFSVEQVGFGWQRCRCQAADKTVKELYYVQWQILPSENKLVLAVDTTIAPSEAEHEDGYFCKDGAMDGDFSVRLANLLGAHGKPLEGVEAVEFLIRSATAEGGEPKDVHLVVDFGNNRTGGLLIEFGGDVRPEPLMNPLQLIHRYHLDAWDEKGELKRTHGSWWFSSRSHWSTTPYLEPPNIEKTVYDAPKKEGWFGGGKQTPRSIFVQPRTFQDLSMVRVGREAHDLALVMRTDGEVRTSVSSPKRYLWAKDESWLEGSNWYMADPSGRYDSERHAATLRGPLLRYLPEDDAAELPEPDSDDHPARPRHAPRVVMTGALYELLAQAYCYVNSPSYRRIAGESMRMRRLRSVTLTYPSGMIQPEREQLLRQARNAAHIFYKTAGFAQQMQPEINLSVDEASAVHLTYIWSEVQKLGKKPSLWFQLMGRGEEQEEPVEAESEETAAPGPSQGGPPRRPGRSRATSKATPSKGRLPEVRVACIDIGGGTTDLMIAKYTCESHAGGDRVQGETLHRDGIYLAGDNLVKRLLERIIVPQFAEAIGLEQHDLMRLFGPEIPGHNRDFRAERIIWMNRLFVPLAQRYLQQAVDGMEDEEISHTDDELVAPEVVDSLQRTINQLWGAGHYDVKQPLGLQFDRDRFEDVVHEVFDDLLFDFCQSIVEYDADVVLLAGLPTKLTYIQELVQTYLPLPKSRIIPMYNRYVGTWYPYQNPDQMNPGVIVDPKSTVVVGAAVDFSARYGWLSQFKFRTKDEAAKRSYYWGVMTESRIDDERILFSSAEGEASKVRETCKLNVTDQRLVIGRKRRSYENAQATPVYVIKVEFGQRMGEIDVNLTLTRNRGPDGEELLEVSSVEGEIAGEPAVLGQNVMFEWRTLADERYYLDIGGLDKIELGT